MFPKRLSGEQIGSVAFLFTDYFREPSTFWTGAEDSSSFPYEQLQELYCLQDQLQLVPLHSRANRALDAMLEVEMEHSCVKPRSQAWTFPHQSR